MSNIEKAKVDNGYLGDIILVNENLIWHSVHKYIGKPEIIQKTYCVEKDDILQLGRVGFIKAIKAFDVTRGIKFSSFAVTAIVREIRCFLRDNGNIVRPTRTANELINRIHKLENDLGYLPSVEDITMMLNEDEEKVQKALRVGKSVKYLDEPLKKEAGSFDEEITLLNLLESSYNTEEEVLDKVYVDNIIKVVQKKLSEREADVLREKVEGLNQTQIAKKKNISQMKVSRIMKKIAKLLKEDKSIEFKEEGA